MAATQRNLLGRLSDINTLGSSLFGALGRCSSLLLVLSLESIGAVKRAGFDHRWGSVGYKGKGKRKAIDAPGAYALEKTAMP